jgi:hypothetical protein
LRSPATDIHCPGGGKRPPEYSRKGHADTD